MQQKKYAHDIIIIGGGIIAYAVAWELAKDNINIAIIRKKQSDIEMATLAAGAMLGALSEIDDKMDERSIVEFEFRLKSQGLFPNWLSEITEASGKKIFCSKGTFIVGNAAGCNDRKILHNIKEFAERYKCDANWVEPKDIPGLNPTNRYMPSLCIHAPHEDAVSPQDLMEAMEIIFNNFPNVTIYDDEVKYIESDTQHHWSIIAKNNIYYANKISICAGSNTFNFLSEEQKTLGCFPALYFGKGVSTVIETDILVPSTIRTPNRAFACGSHVVPHQNKRLYLGATNFFGEDHVKERGIEIGELHILFDQAIHQINTGFRTAKIIEHRFGYRPILSFTHK